jgi:FkbM family methyltransferase
MAGHHSIQHAEGQRMRFERLRRSKAFAYIKGPLLHLRNFLTSPVLGRVDGVHAVLSTHQRLLGQALDRTQTMEGQLRAAEQRLESLQETVGTTAARLDKVYQSVGFLHQKADDAVVKSRPVVHLQDAYAVPLRDGYLFIPEQDEGLLLMYTGAGPDGLEPGTRRILQMITPPKGCAIDVGASVGLHTLALARSVGAGGRLFAFEAEPRLERHLRRTLSANGLHQVSLHMLAAGDKNSKATFHVAKTIGHSSLYALESDDQEREAVEVEIRRLDDVIAKDVLVDVIKIDVEGAELDVLKGAEQILQRSPECAIVAELGPSHLKRIGTPLEDWLGAFTQQGFQAFSIEEPFGNVTPADVEWLARQHSVNMLFVKAGSFARAALAESQAISRT